MQVQWWGYRDEVVDSQTLPYAREFVWTLCTRRWQGCCNFGCECLCPIHPVKPSLFLALLSPFLKIFPTQKRDTFYWVWWTNLVVMIGFHLSSFPWWLTLINTFCCQFFGNLQSLSWTWLAWLMENYRWQCPPTVQCEVVVLSSSQIPFVGLWFTHRESTAVNAIKIVRNKAHA